MQEGHHVIMACRNMSRYIYILLITCPVRKCETLPLRHSHSHQALCNELGWVSD